MRPLLVLAVSVAVLVGCSSEPEVTAAPSSSYCTVVDRTAGAMAGTVPAEKRPAMAELRDAAPAEIRGYWDEVVADETELAQRDLARARIAEYEAANC